MIKSRSFPSRVACEMRYRSDSGIPKISGYMVRSQRPGCSRWRSRCPSWIDLTFVVAKSEVSVHCEMRNLGDLLDAVGSGMIPSCWKGSFDMSERMMLSFMMRRYA